MSDNPIEWDKKEIEVELDGLVEHGHIRGWFHQNGRYAVQYTDSQYGDDEPLIQDVILTFPQAQAFVAGVHAGMGWVLRVAQEVKADG